MRSVKLAAAIPAVALALTGAAPALAHGDHGRRHRGHSYIAINSGSTALTLSDATTSALASHNITLAPTSPATASGSTFTFPISGGKADGKGDAVLFHHGGFTITAGSTTVPVSDPVVGIYAGHAALFGGVPVTRTSCEQDGNRGQQPRNEATTASGTTSSNCRTVTHETPVLLARLTNLSTSGSTTTATVLASKATAALLDKLAGTEFLHAGDTLGTATVTITSESTQSSQPAYSSSSEYRGWSDGTDESSTYAEHHHHS